MQQTVQKWNLFEAEFSGPADGNPFTDVELEAEFSGPGGLSLTAPGFYDGDGASKVRFMPTADGEWTFATRSNCVALDGQRGRDVPREP